MLKNYSKIDYLLPFFDMSKNESNILIIYTLLTTMYENAFFLTSLLFLQVVLVKFCFNRFQKKKDILIRQDSIEDIYKDKELDNTNDDNYGHFINLDDLDL